MVCLTILLIILSNKFRGMDQTKKHLTLRVPTCWEELSQKELFLFFDLWSNPLLGDTERKVLFVVGYNGLTIERSPYRHGEYLATRKVSFWYGVLHGVPRYRLRPGNLLQAVEVMAWADTPPRDVLSQRMIAHCEALDPLLHGVTFETWLIIENLYQGYLQTEEEEVLQRLAQVLYPDLRPRTVLRRAHLYGILFWMGGLRSYLYARFPHLFRPTVPGGAPPDMEEVMNAQIRALTGGDVTKEREVLRTDVWRVLTELDAKARETQQSK